MPKDSISKTVKAVNSNTVGVTPICVPHPVSLM